MLEELASAMGDAGRLADRIADLCERGEAVEPAVSHLTEQVARIEALIATGPGVPAAIEAAVRELADRVSAVTARIESQKVAVAVELESLAQRDRVRRTYQRPPG